MKTALTLAALLVAATAQAETWDPATQFSKTDDWHAVGFDVGAKHEKLFFHAITKADRSKPEYAPSGDKAKDFTFSVPLIRMTPAAGKPLPTGAKPTPNHFTTEPTDWRLNVKMVDKAITYAAVCQGTCPGAPGAATVRALNANDGITGLDAKGTPAKVVPPLVIEPPTGSPTTTVEQQPDTEPLKAKLSDWEKRTAKDLGIELASCGDDAGCRTALKMSVADQLTKPLDPLHYTKDKNYVLDRLGKETPDGKKFLAAEAWATEQGPAAITTFQKKWHTAVAADLTAYNAAKSPAAYDAAATKDGVTAALAAEPDAPTTDLGKALAKVFAEQTPAAAAERNVMEKLWQGSPETIAMIKGLAAKPDGAKKAELRAEARQSIRDYILKKDASSPLGKSGLADKDLLAAYCPGVATGGAAADGMGGGKTLEVLKTTNQDLRGQVGSGSDADAGAKTYDKKTAAASGDPLAKQCSEYNSQNAIAKFKETPATGDLTVGKGKGDGTTKIDPVDKNDKGGKAKGAGSEIGSGAAVTDGGSSDDFGKHVAAGIGIGAWAGILGAIFLGPVGLLIGGAVGLVAGYALDKFTNSKT